MNNLIIKLLAATIFLFISGTLMAQTTELTLEIKGITEKKGNILITVQSSEDPQQVIYDRIPVAEKNSITHIFKDVPAGKADISIFHDLNENYKLDTDENNIPVEPCYTKKNVNIQGNSQKLSMKLINVKEAMNL